VVVVVVVAMVVVVMVAVVVELPYSRLICTLYCIYKYSYPSQQYSQCTNA
jgi:hypothetical protein